MRELALHYFPADCFGIEQEIVFGVTYVVYIFCSGGKKVVVLHTTYVLRVPYSCGVVLVFLVLAGNCVWCYLST